MKQLWAKEEIVDATKDNVKANPTLAGTETELTGIEVNGIKYSMPSGGSEVHLYVHSIFCNNSSTGRFYIMLYTADGTAFTNESFKSYITDTLGLSSFSINCAGYFIKSNENYPTVYLNASGRYYRLGYTNNIYVDFIYTNITSFTDTVTQIF